MLAPECKSNKVVSAGTKPTIRAPKIVTTNGILYSDKAKDLYELRYDEEAAQAEAEAQGGVPGYCGDRYFRAFAGGHYCEKFEK